MLIGRFGKMSLHMGVEGNGDSVQDFVLNHSEMVAAEFGVCLHMIARWIAFPSRLTNASRQDLIFDMHTLSF